MKLLWLPLLLAASATADTLPSQDLFANASTGCPGLSSCSEGFSFVAQQFDPSLGTLLSVDFTFSDTETVSWNVFGSGGTSGTQTIESLASASLLALNTNASSGYLVSPPCSPTPCSGDAINNLAATGVVFSSDFVGTGTVPISFTTSAIFGTFTGTGVFSHHVESIQDQASLEVTYNYKPVPEPSYVWVVSMGMLVTLAVRKVRGAR